MESTLEEFNNIIEEFNKTTIQKKRREYNNRFFEKNKERQKGDFFSIYFRNTRFFLLPLEKGKTKKKALFSFSSLFPCSVHSRDAGFIQKCVCEREVPSWHSFLPFFFFCVLFFCSYSTFARGAFFFREKTKKTLFYTVGIRNNKD